jgi:lipid II:glycine glycyltransferase (peptidoglycan interpeptide bridge formation enzyme)
LNNKELYRSFCAEHSSLPVFVQDWYLDSVCEGGEWDVALVKEQEEIIASLPYFVKKRWGFSYIAMPFFVKHMGPYIIPEKDKLKNHLSIYNQLIEQLPDVDCFKQHFHPKTKNWLPFYWRKFKASPRYTYELAIEDLDQTFKGINRNMRRNIKKAGLSLHAVQTDDVASFFDLHKRSMLRQGTVLPYSIDFFRRHYEALLSHHAGKMIFIQDKEGTVYAAACLTWDSERAYYHLSGDEQHLRKSGAGILLIWECIKFAQKTMGLSIFDFEGSMMPNIEPIRLQFGAQQLLYFEVHQYYSKLYQWLDNTIK